MAAKKAVAKKAVAKKAVAKKAVAKKAVAKKAVAKKVVAKKVVAKKVVAKKAEAENRFPTQEVEMYLAAAPTSEFNGMNIHMIAEWEGTDNLLWRVRADERDAVLKLYLDAGQARSRRQFDGMQMFAPLGSSPRPLWFDRYPEGLSRQVLVYEWAEGDALDPAEPFALEALADTMAEVHSADPNDVRRFSPVPLNLDFYWRVERGSFAQIQEWLQGLAVPTFAELFDGLVARYEELVAGALPLWNSVPPTPVHGDPRLENQLLARGRAILLDWEMFGLGDPAREIASFFYLNQDSLSARGKAEFLAHYLTRVAPANLAERVSIYEQLLPFQTICYLLNGLRTMPEELPDGPNTLAFLQETLNVSLQQVTDQSQLNFAPVAAMSDALFGQL